MNQNVKDVAHNKPLLLTASLAAAHEAPAELCR